MKKREDKDSRILFIRGPSVRPEQNVWEWYLESWFFFYDVGLGESDKGIKESAVRCCVTSRTAFTPEVEFVQESSLCLDRGPIYRALVGMETCWTGSGERVGSPRDQSMGDELSRGPTRGCSRRPSRGSGEPKPKLRGLATVPVHSPVRVSILAVIQSTPAPSQCTRCPSPSMTPWLTNFQNFESTVL